MTPKQQELTNLDDVNNHYPKKKHEMMWKPQDLTKLDDVNYLKYM